MSLPTLGPVPDPVVVIAAAVVAPLALAWLVYIDARRRRTTGRGASLAPLAWAATTFFSGPGCPVVVACYAVVRSR
jgi:hypothetical protein